MKTNSYFILFALCCIAGCVSTRSGRDCQNKLNGKYINYVYNPGGMGHWTKMTFYIEINDSFQVITRQFPVSDTGIYRVTWPGRCKYNLKRINPQTPLDSAFLRLFPKGQTYRIKLLTPDYFIQKAGSQTDTLWRNH